MKDLHPERLPRRFSRRPSLLVWWVSEFSTMVRAVSPYVVIKLAILQPSRARRWRAWRYIYAAHEGWAVELFVVASMGLLLLGNLLVGDSPVVLWTLTGVALWRLSDILATQVGIVVRDRELPHHSVISLSRSVLLGLVNLAEVIFIFSLLDKSLVVGRSNVFIGPIPGMTPMSSPLGFVYLSWTTLLTLGSGFTPSTWPAQLAVMSEVGTGLLIIAVTLSVFVSGIHIEDQLHIDQ